MPSLAILADDLSGAADCGVACTAAGLRTVVVLDDQAARPEADVVSIDADTRGMTAAAAASQTERLTRRHAPAGCLLYKKLDSTLRGHVGAELAAALRVRREAGPAWIVLAPAFPAASRTTVGGIQRLGGMPLHDTDVWRHETVAHRADIPAILRDAGLLAAPVSLGQVRAPGLSAVLGALRHGDAMVCDAETEADLEAVADAAAALGPQTVWAGSAGLARHLPRALRLDRPAPPTVLPPAAGPILFVVGSASAVSRSQTAALAREGVALLTVPAGVLRAGPAVPAWAVQGRALTDALGSGQDAAVLLGAEGTADPGEGPRLCRALARMVAPHAPRVGGLVATGGETARAVLQAFGADTLHLAGEVEPGVPLSVAGGIRHLPVVTKAGAFGTPGTLARCRTALRQGSSHPSPESAAP